MIVDVHSHHVPLALVKEVKAGLSETPSVSVVGEEEERYRFKLGDQPPTRILPKDLLDLDQRLNWMDEVGIDVQVLAPWVDLFGYHLPVVEGIAWSRLLNDALKETVAGSNRFACLASVPLQDADAAAQVMSDALDTGFAGVMIGTRVNHTDLDAPELEPFWAAASEYGAAVFLHPGFAQGDPRLGDFGLINAVGRIQDTTVTAARLLYAGVPVRYSGAKIILSHGGGALPYVLGRLVRNHAIKPEAQADPEEGFKRLYFDSVVFDPEALRLLYSKAGSGSVMMGSDYPFPIGDFTPRHVIHKAGLDESETNRMLSKTAGSVFLLARES